VHVPEQSLDDRTPAVGLATTHLEGNGHVSTHARVALVLRAGAAEAASIVLSNRRSAAASTGAPVRCPAQSTLSASP
jgi:hypothetical protein